MLCWAMFAVLLTCKPLSEGEITKSATGGDLVLKSSFVSFWRWGRTNYTSEEIWSQQWFLLAGHIQDRNKLDWKSVAIWHLPHICDFPC